MADFATPTCYVIGDENITLQCCEVLLMHGFKVKSLVSRDPNSVMWSAEKGIELYQVLEAIDEADYLFSIANYRLIPEALLAKAHIAAINFHDSPLPNYAGLHAPAWAILNGETYHGISWHLMNAKIDGGDILVQETFPISDKETTLSLNLRCLQVGLSSFQTLLPTLKQRKITASPQHPNVGSYYGLHTKPESAGVLDWQWPAQKLSRYVRALNVGEKCNRFCSPKCFVKSQMYLVNKLETLSVCSDKKAGVIVAIHKEGWQITTGTQDIILTELYDTSGRRCKLQHIEQLHQLKVGDTFNQCHLPDKHILKQVCEQASQDEAFWVSQWSKVRTPYFLGNSIAQQTKQAQFVKLNRIVFLEDSETFIAALAIFLYCFFEESNVVINLFKPLALEYQGLCSSWRPLCLELKPSLKVSELLAHVKKTIQTLLSLEPPSKDLFFRYPSITNTNGPIGFVESSDKYLSYLTKEHMLVFVLEPITQTITAYLNRGLSLVDKEVVAQFISSLPALSRKLNKNSEHSIDNFSIVDLDPAYYQQAVHTWNQTDRTYPQEDLVSLFEKQSLIQPNAIATSFEGKKLTYKELNQFSNQLANYLLSSLPNTTNNKSPIVALCFDRCIEMVVAIIAILKAGCCYLPLDPKLPPSRKDYIISDARPLVVLTMANYASEFEDGLNPTVVDIRQWQLFQTYSKDNLQLTKKLDAPIYVIYTSGSTGKPKGAVNLHQGLLNRVVWMHRHFDLSPAGVFVQKTPYYFDISFWEIFVPLTIGAKCVIARPEGHKDPVYLARLLAKEEVSIVHFVPSMLHIFLEHVKLTHYPCLKAVITSGETLPKKLAQTFLSKLPDIDLVNLYGPTEASIEVSYHHCQLNESLESVPIGKPIDNVKLYVLDEQLRPRPVGSKGQLAISGVAVAKGYLNQPNLSKQRFVLSPFDDQPMFLTGDIARRLPSGELEFLGRGDEQVKHNGNRIELGEIEKVLCSFEHVKACAVIFKQKGETGQIVAFIVSPNFTLTTEELRRHCGNKLPGCMIPTAFYFLKRMPVTANGKLDKNALQQWDMTNVSLIKTTEITDSVCQRLQRIFSNALAIEANRVKLNSDFFSLGGDSLVAIKVVMLINEAFSVNHTASLVFENRTVSALAKVLKSGKANSIHSVDATFNQTVKLPAGAAYLVKEHKRFENRSIVIAYVWQGTFYRCHFLKALTYLLHRHEVLTANIVWHRGTPHFLKSTRQVSDIINEQEINANDTYDVYQHVLSQAVDVMNDPLFQVKLAIINENKLNIFFLFHHVIVDKYAIEIAINDLFNTYNQLLTDKPMPLASEISYLTYLEGGHKRLINEPRPLAKVPAPHLLSCHTTSLKAEYVEKLLSINEKRINEIIHSHHASPFGFFVTVFQQALMQYFQLNKLNVGYTQLSRHALEHATMVGHMTNQAIIHQHGCENFNKMLLLTMSQIAFNYQYDHFTQPDISNSFNVYFDYEPGEATSVQVLEAQLTRLPSLQTSTMTRILTGRVRCCEGRYYLGVRYRTGVIKPKDIEQIVSIFVNICHGLTSRIVSENRAIRAKQ